MGTERVAVIEVVATVSRHNSDRDRSDDALVEELRERISAIVNEEKYQAIYAFAV